MFERNWKGRPASQAGAGLGLYIAKGIVEDSSPAGGHAQGIQRRETVPNRSVA
jgi:signal transduction histidine kinase